MLEFNPFMRITSHEALKNKIFDKIRVDHFEKPCSAKLDHEIYQDGVMDYESGQCKTLQIKDLKKMMMKEVKKLQKKNAPTTDNAD